MLELRPYQQKTALLGATTNLLINFDCGLGKTFTAIAVADAYMRAHDMPQNIGGVLVVAPKHLRYQWAKMIHDMLGDDVPITLLSTGVVPTLDSLDGWTLTHYEALTGRLLVALAQKVFRVIIVDEAHHIKNRKAKRTEAVKELSAIRKLGLTATPMDRSPAELWSILNWLFPGEFTSYWKFVNRYCETEDVPPWFTKSVRPVVKIVGSKNREELADLLKDKLVYYSKTAVAPELPPRIMQRVPVEMTEHQAELYNVIAKSDDILVTVAKGELIIPNAIAKIVRLQQITSLPAALGSLGTGVSSGKVDWILRYTSDNPEEVMVIFSRFRATANELARRLSCEVVIGGQNEQPKDFLSGNARFVVGTIDAMGEGIDGLQRASTAIFVDQVWSTARMTQALDRIHRLGIDEPKNIIYLYCPNTRDELVLKALDNKWTDQELVYAHIEELQRHGTN